MRLSAGFPSRMPLRANCSGLTFDIRRITKLVHDQFYSPQLVEAQGKVPMTIVTGYLGSGKSTLLDYILKDTGRPVSQSGSQVGQGSHIVIVHASIRDAQGVHVQLFCCHTLRVRTSLVGRS
jgi:hypothetical protein